MSLNFNDFQKQDVKFDIDELKKAYNEILKIKDFSGPEGISNFGAISLTQIPGDPESIKGHKARGVFWTKPDATGKEVIRDEKLIENAHEKGSYLIEQLKLLSEDFPGFVTNPRGVGLFSAFDLPSMTERDHVWRKMMENDLLILTSGDNSIRFRPHLNVLKDDIDIAMDIIKKSINIGMATAVENGNLIVPVIRNADHLNLKGLTLAVNDLSTRARSNSLKPDEITDGTYTVTNVGNFGSIMGTPIINQPQVGIIAIGVIRKLPSVIETDKGDFVGIRKKLILSHTYDHRIINGSVGGSFVKRVAEYLEGWDMNQTI